MSKRLYREFYLLPRGEQRALIVLSLLLILSLFLRITVQLLPEREPEGLEEFEQEAKQLLAALAEADSLKSVSRNAREKQGRTSLTHHKEPLSQTRTRIGANPIDINRADSAQLLPLPGIGPVFAGRIIKYRNLLGGFVSIDQLGEVYGISQETLQKIRDKIVLDSAAIRKIRVDTASFRELLRHPYLEYEEVKALVKYRDFKGDITCANELRMNQILSDSTLSRINEYFDYSRRTVAVDLSK